MSSEKKSVSDLAAEYIGLRGKVEELEAQIKEIEKDMDELTRQMSEICEETGASSIRTDSGTIIRSIRTRYFTSDWSSLHDIVLQYQAPYLLEKRIHNSAMKEFLEAHPEAYPAGLNIENQYTITVRKPSKKI